MHLDVTYPVHDEGLTIPDSFLPAVIKTFRDNLELGAALEEELGGYGLHSLLSIEKEEGEETSEREYKHGINSPLFRYFDLLQALLKVDALAAKSEIGSWRGSTGPIAAHLIIWSLNDKRLVPRNEIADVLRIVSREEFWNSAHQRDLLLALSARWSEMPTRTKQSIERRILQGRKRWPRESGNDFKESRAHAILNRIHYLHSKQCVFTFDIDAVSRTLQADAPQWKPEWAKGAAFSMGMRTGWVKTDTRSDELQDKPLSEILDVAASLSGRAQDRFFVERDPFAGLCDTKPVRAFGALNAALRDGKFRDEFWREFLNHTSSRQEKVRFSVLIACRLARLPDESLSKILNAASDWMLRVHKNLLPDHREILNDLWGRLVPLLARPDAERDRGGARAQSVDWATEALNSPVGYLAQLLLTDSVIGKLDRNDRMPDWWKIRADELLSLPKDHRRHALAILCHNLVWLFARDEAWVISSLLPCIQRQDADSDAFWAGFFWGARIPQPPLFKLIKPALLRLAHRQSETRRKHAEILAGMILAGWGARVDDGDARAVSDAELTHTLQEADDEFREQLLWHLQNWTKRADEKWREDAFNLLKRVWPKQISLKTPRISAKLAELAFAQGSRFPLFVDCILPLLVPTDQDYINLPIERHDNERLVEKYPESVLSLLDAILGENARHWPYGVSDILDRVEKSKPELLADVRMIKLKRVRSTT
ncbi:hypothetical protein ASG57_10800 [Bradyrhizobium sp. Leaf396]|nr:hypothetical protein ASG57_10800 [Bradyrhizobium sp. Leaf396]